MKINRKEIKKNAHKNLKKNFFVSILIIFIFGIIINGSYLPSSKVATKTGEAQEIQAIIYNEETKKIEFNKLFEENAKENNEKVKGVLQPMVNRLGLTRSPLNNFAYSIKLFVFDHSISLGMYSLLISIISIILFFLVEIILEIGKNRFYLESRIYNKTSALRLLFPYKIKGTLHLSIIMFFRRIYQILWSITIVGGFIKMYEYKMIPYVLAENPTIKRKEAFRLSKEMMKGYKWQAFKLDLSLIGWFLLGLITFGLSNLVYYNAYKEYIYAELYVDIRNNKKNDLTDSKLLNDTYLYNEKNNLNIYPEDKIKVPLKRISINTDYNQKYPVRNIILFFFTVSFIGYSWEVFLHILMDGTFINRGTMFGPWLPIYGTGTVLILLLLKSFRNKPFLFFIACMILAGIVEYSASWYLDTFAHMKWWDYHGYLFNINGRICLEGLLVFGLGGAAITYFLAPLLNSLFNKIKYKTVVIICILLLTVFGVDVIYSVNHPNTGKGITDY